MTPSPLKQSQVIEVPGVGNVEFPAEMDDAAIAKAIQVGLKGPKTLAGFGENIISSGGKFLGDLAQGVSDLAGRGVQAVLDPGGAVKDIAGSHPLDALARMKDFYKKRYGGAQNIADTLYEDPVGVASDVATVASGVGGAAKLGSKLATLSRVPMAASGLESLARGAGAVAEATNPLNITRVPMAMIPKKATSALATRLQESALKIPPSVDRADRMAMVDASLQPENRITANLSGLKKTRANIDSINDTVDKAVADAATAGKTVDPEVAAGYTKRSHDLYSESSAPEKDLATVEDVKSQFMRKHSAEAPFTTVRPATEYDGYVPTGSSSTQVPQQIPIDAAQAEKRANYRKVRESAFGELATPEKETLKDLARGLKDQVYDQLPPNIQTLGPKEKVLIDLENVLERFANREGNKQLIGIEGPIATIAHPALGAIVQFIDRNPALKSRIAIAMANRGGPAGSILSTTNALKMAGPPAAMYGSTLQQQ